MEVAEQYIEHTSNGCIKINLHNKNCRSIIMYCTLLLFKEYKFPLSIARKHYLGCKSNEDLFFALKRMMKELAKLEYKATLNQTTRNDDFDTKVSAKVSEYIVGLIWSNFTFISEVDQIKYNLADYKYEDVNIDVKSKRRTSRPNPSYDIIIPNSQRNQKTDFYICSHIDMKFKEILLMGMISKVDFWKMARESYPGEVAGNGIPYEEGSFILPYSKIHTWDANFNDKPIVPYYA